MTSSLPTTPTTEPEHVDVGAPPAVTAMEPVAATDDPGAVEEFDLDTWINAVDRPSREVYLFNPLKPEGQLRLRGLEATLADAEDRLARARHAEEQGVERSVTDPGSAAIEEEVAVALQAVLDFRDEQRRTALKVTVTQVTIDERITAERDAAAAGIEREWQWLQWACQATTLPNGAHPTVEQLRRLVGRDVSGQSQVVALRRAIEELSATPTVPTSPGSSTGRAGRTSSAS